MGGSNADLLFKIGADSAEGQAALGQFRQVMSQQLGGMGAQFTRWSQATVGALGSVKIAMLAGGAALAAGVVAAGSALTGAAIKAAEYADEIDDARAVTGIAVEDLSKLRYAAKMNDVEFGELTNSLRFFARTIDEARKGSGEQFEAFKRMGIGQAEIQAGAKAMLPLLMRVSDAFAANAVATEKAAVARVMFGRGAGPDFIGMLNQEAGSLEQLSRRAAELGQVLTEKDIEAAQRFRMEMKDLEARMQATELVAGRASMGLVAAWTRIKAALLETATTEEDLPWWITWTPLAVGATIARVRDAYVRIGKELEEVTKAALVRRPRPFLEPEGVKKIYTEFEGLSNMLGQVRMRLASMGGEEERVEADSARMGTELEKASARLRELHGEAKITGVVFERESRALELLPAAMKKVTDAQWKQVIEARAEALRGAGRELTERLFGMGEPTWEHRREAVRREAAEMRRQHTAQKTLTAEHAQKIAEIEKEGLSQIEGDRIEAFRQELLQLQEHMAQIVTLRMTSRERIGWQYEQDLVRFSEVEKAKVLRRKWGVEEAWALEQQFAINREAALERYEREMRVLQNSEGWQGFFGAKFGELIRGNEELSRAWAERTSRSALDVRVAVEGLRTMGKRAFDEFAQAMGAAGAEALLYGRNFGAAMREATAQALASLSAQSIAYAIYYTALGFARLAEFLPGSAAHAFQAAALFGTAGVTSAALGRAIAPRSEGAGGAGGGGGGIEGQGGAAGASERPAKAGPTVTIYIQGHVVGRAGIEELTEMINEAVKDRDVRLIATQVRQETRVIR